MLEKERSWSRSQRLRASRAPGRPRRQRGGFPRRLCEEGLLYPRRDVPGGFPSGPCRLRPGLEHSTGKKPGQGARPLGPRTSPPLPGRSHAHLFSSRLGRRDTCAGRWRSEARRLRPRGGAGRKARLPGTQHALRAGPGVRAGGGAKAGPRRGWGRGEGRRLLAAPDGASSSYPAERLERPAKTWLWVDHLV